MLGKSLQLETLGQNLYWKVKKVLSSFLQYIIVGLSTTVQLTITRYCTYLSIIDGTNCSKSRNLVFCIFWKEFWEHIEFYQICNVARKRTESEKAMETRNAIENWKQKQKEACLEPCQIIIWLFKKTINS